MNKEFHDIIERVPFCFDMEIGSRISIPALINLNERLERLEALLLPEAYKKEAL